LRIEHPGGNEHSHEADRIKGLTDYVNLCFSNNHPMEYRARKEGRIEQTRFLRINPEILRVDGAKITLDVANKAGVPLLDPSDALKQIDYEVLYTRTDWNDPAVKERLNAARKCEILIPTKVARELIISGL
jgi:ssDNA thymidine ADP-ribosyltransferase, DarT